MNGFILSAALAGQGSAAAPSQGGFESNYFFLMIATIGLLFYFIILRPQNREQKRQQEVLNAIKKGDKVESIGGIHGTVLSVDTTRNIVTVQVDKNCKLDFSRSAIKSVSRKDDQKDGEEAKKSDK
jgi:preprotein translocase subunit YajC